MLGEEVGTDMTDWYLVLIHLSRTVGDKANPFRLEFCFQKQSGSSQQNAVPLELCRFVALSKRRATGCFWHILSICQFQTFGCMFEHVSLPRSPPWCETSQAEQQGFTPCTWGPIADGRLSGRASIPNRTGLRAEHKDSIHWVRESEVVRGKRSEKDIPCLIHHPYLPKWFFWGVTLPKLFLQIIFWGPIHINNSPDVSKSFWGATISLVAKPISTSSSYPPRGQQQFDNFDVQEAAPVKASSEETMSAA